MLRDVLRKPFVKQGLVVVSLLPFIWLFAAAFLDQLGPNPAEYLIRSTGEWALRFLCILPLRWPGDDGRGFRVKTLTQATSQGHLWAGRRRSPS